MLLGGCTLGPTELAIILAIVVLLFGATRLPALARALGESMRHFKKAASEEDESDKSLPPTKDVKQIENARVKTDDET
jgi:sec-independent protein translocase protein TatA